LRTLGVDHEPASRDVDNLKSKTVFFKDGDSSHSDGHHFDGNKNYMSLLTSGRNTHRGSVDANTLKFTSLFDKTSTSSSLKKPHKPSSGWPTTASAWVLAA